MLIDFSKAVGPSPLGLGDAKYSLVAEWSSEVIETVPNTYGLIQSLGLFTPEPITQHTVLIDLMENELVLIPESERGTPGEKSKAEVIKTLPLVIPHFALDDFLTPNDVQGRRAPGSQGPDTKTRKMAQKLTSIRKKHALTLEFMRLGAIKGTLVGGSGNTIYNYFTELGQTQKTIDFDFGTDTSEIHLKILELKRYIEENLLAGDINYGITALCSSKFFDELITHPTMKEAYKYFAAQPNILREDVRNRFEHGGVNFIEYNGTVKFKSGSTSPLIGVGEAYAFPTGVEGMFKTFYSPADRFGYENTEGQELYVWEFADPEGRFIKLSSESNPLCFNSRPRACVKLDDGIA